MFGGVEIGGTWTRAVSIDRDGRIIAETRCATPSSAALAVDLLPQLWRDSGSPPVVGVASACELDGALCATRWPSRPEWIGSHPLSKLAEHVRIATTLDDATAACVSEHLVATQEDGSASSSVLISVGTGVGGGAVIDDRPLLGSNNRAMDLGHIAVPSASGRTCSCGRSGCLQSLVSGKALLTAAGSDRDGNMFETWGRALAEAIDVCIGLFDPSRIIVAGGLIEATPLFLSLSRELESRCDIPILRSRLGTHAGALGAALCAARAVGARISRIYRANEVPNIRIGVINGPNLDLLGIREPEIYGLASLDQIEAQLRTTGERLGVRLFFVQSNHEGVLVDWIRESAQRIDGYVLNPAGLTAHGLALRDAMLASRRPFLEIHLSNVEARGKHHRVSCFSDIAAGRISGIGALGYDLAVEALYDMLRRMSAERGGEACKGEAS